MPQKPTINLAAQVLALHATRKSSKLSPWPIVPKKKRVRNGEKNLSKNFENFYKIFTPKKALAQFNNDPNAAALSILTSQMAG